MASRRMRRRAPTRRRTPRGREDALAREPRAAPELVHHLARAATLRACRRGEIRARRIAIAALLERRILRHFGPHAAAHRPEEPMHVTGARGRLDQLVR